MKIISTECMRTKRARILLVLFFTSPFYALISGFKPSNPIIVGVNVEEGVLIAFILGLLSIAFLYLYLFLIVRRVIKSIQVKVLARPIIYLLHFYLMIFFISLFLSMGLILTLIYGSSAYEISFFIIRFSPPAYMFALSYIFSAIGAYLFFSFALHIYKPEDSNRALNAYVIAVFLDIGIILSSSQAFGNIAEPNLISIVPKILTSILFLPPIIIITIRSIKVIVHSKSSMIKVRNKVLIMGNSFFLISIILLMSLKFTKANVFSAEYVLAHLLLILGILLLYKAFS